MSILTKNDKAKVYVGGLSVGITEEDIRHHFKKYFPVRMELKTANGFAFVEFEEEVDARDAIKYMDGSVMCERRIAVRPCGPSRAVREQPRGPPPPGPYPERGYPERGPDRGYGGASERGYGGPPERDYPDRGAPLPPPSGDRFSGPPPPMRGPAGVAYGYRVEVENLSARTSWQDLKDFGRQAGGSIKYADVFNGEQGKTGVISYAQKEEADRAVTILHGQTLDGEVIRVYEDRGTHPPRGHQGDRGSAPRGPPSGGYGNGDRFPPSDRFQSRGGPPPDFRDGGHHGRAPPPPHFYDRERRRSPSPPPRDYPRRSRSRSRERRDPRGYDAPPAAFMPPRDPYGYPPSHAPAAGRDRDSYCPRDRSPPPPPLPHARRRSPSPDAYRRRSPERRFDQHGGAPFAHDGPHFDQPPRRDYGYRERSPLRR